jgi:hypothetical protein
MRFIIVYVQLKAQLDMSAFICILYSSLFLALHVSGAICTHPQEHKLQRTKRINPLEQILAGTPSHMRVPQPVLAPVD